MENVKINLKETAKFTFISVLLSLVGIIPILTRDDIISKILGLVLIYSGILNIIVEYNETKEIEIDEIGIIIRNREKSKRIEWMDIKPIELLERNKRKYICMRCVEYSKKNKAKQKIIAIIDTRKNRTIDDIDRVLKQITIIQNENHNGYPAVN